MSWGVTASPPGYYPRTPLHHPLPSSYFRPIATGSHKFPRVNLRCNCSSKPGESGPGENESRTVLDAFFLGKALAEALNERIESTLGEFLSTIGRLQAEQQKQVQEFQEDVLERAERAKKQAAREALEAQGLIPKSSEPKITTATNGVSSAASSSQPNSLVERVKMDPGPANEDLPSEISEED
ncbi:unnamed protein product [Fraxinus pennsylvanica]|uniref:Uncharacterized protein n=1 Tax=Fraxinus pennsylvanica TaxID=56036 RepID=A0AAD1ZGP9_9LAMI|nr:unnamed protein product [Fraxinus pennsylvanica]